MILAAFKSLTQFLSLPLSLSLLSTSLRPSFSQKIRYRHPSIPKCSLQLQGVQNFKLHRSLLQSLAGHLHLLPFPGLVESVRARPHVHVTTPSHLEGSCFDVTGARAGDAEDLQASKKRNNDLRCVTLNAGLASLLPLFGCPNPSASRFFFKLSALKDRRKSFFRRFRGAIAWPAAGCQRKRRSFLNLQMYVLFVWLFESKKCIQSLSRRWSGCTLDVCRGTFQLFVSVFKRFDPSGIIVFLPRLLMWWWLLVKSLQTRHHFTTLWPSPNLPCFLLLHVKKCPGWASSRACWRARETQSRISCWGRPGWMEISQTQMYWMPMWHMCPFVFGEGYGAARTLSKWRCRDSQKMLEVGRSLADVFARNPEIIWVQRPEVIVKHAWTCEQRLFFSSHYVFEGTPSEAV